MPQVAAGGSGVGEMQTRPHSNPGLETGPDAAMLEAAPSSEAKSGSAEPVCKK